MDRAQQRRIIEALILASPEPITPARLAQIAPECTPALASELIDELNASYAEHDRAFEIWKVAGGHQIRTRAEFSGYLQQLKKERPLRLSRAALEGLAIIAYRQPVTRGEIDEVRGVDTGAVVKSLMERQLVKIVGQKEVPGRPMLYGTTRRFLEIFGLESIKKLPTLRELEEIARESGLAQPEGAAGEPSAENSDENSAENSAESSAEDTAAVVEGVLADESAGDVAAEATRANAVDADEQDAASAAEATRAETDGAGDASDPQGDDEVASTGASAESASSDPADDEQDDAEEDVAVAPGRATGGG